MNFKIENDDHSSSKLKLCFEEPRSSTGTQTITIRLTSDEIMELYAFLGSWTDNFYVKDAPPSPSSDKWEFL